MVGVSVIFTGAGVYLVAVHELSKREEAGDE